MQLCAQHSWHNRYLVLLNPPDELAPQVCGKACNVACLHASVQACNVQGDKSSRTEPLHKPPAERAQWNASESVGPLTAGGKSVPAQMWLTWSDTAQAHVRQARVVGKVLEIQRRVARKHHRVPAHPPQSAARCLRPTHRTARSAHRRVLARCGRLGRADGSVQPY